MKENKWCDTDNKIVQLKTLSDVQRGCVDDINCTMFYDFKSDGETFYTCNYRVNDVINSAPKISKSSVNSSLYIKCKMLLEYKMEHLDLF